LLDGVKDDAAETGTVIADTNKADAIEIAANFTFFILNPSSSN
jgi:hypothetical protein